MGSPVGAAAMASAKRLVNSSAMSLTTMKRLAQMQAWPLFCRRAVTARGIVWSRSAEAATTKGSEPPSSSTHFFRYLPAKEATERPARSEPVTVTAAMRSSAMMGSMRLDSTNRLVKMPWGKPARVKMPSTYSAQPGTLEECFRTIGLPAMMFGTATRMICHRGKFQGMMASSGPSGS